MAKASSRPHTRTDSSKRLIGPPYLSSSISSVNLTLKVCVFPFPLITAYRCFTPRILRTVGVLTEAICYRSIQQSSRTKMLSVSCIPLNSSALLKIPQTFGPMNIHPSQPTQCIESGFRPRFCLRPASRVARRRFLHLPRAPPSGAPVSHRTFSSMHPS